jgi:transcriptional regulator with XRE-family HTH domain
MTRVRPRPSRPLTTLEAWVKCHVHQASRPRFLGTLVIQGGLTRTEARLVTGFALDAWGMLTLDEIAQVLGWPEGMSLVAWRASASHFSNLKRKGLELPVVRPPGNGKPLGRAFIWSEVFTAPVQGPKRDRIWTQRRPRYGRKPVADLVLSQALHAYRRRYCLTQEQLAVRLGVSRTALTGWIGGRKPPGRLAYTRTLGLDLDPVWVEALATEQEAMEEHWQQERDQASARKLARQAQARQRRRDQDEADAVLARAWSKSQKVTF